MTGSIVFDQAVEYYDRTRALPRLVAAALTAMLAEELRERGRVLEIGVGTGRIALPLAAAGIDIVGLDLSRPMLRRLRANAGPASVPAVEGDATALPIPRDCVGAALASHVFHLIPAWRDAFAELRRVVRPGGTVLVTRGGGWPELTTGLATQFFAAAGGEIHHPGAQTLEEVDAAAVAIGLVPRPLPQVTWTVEVSPAEIIDAFEQGLWSTTWGLAEATRIRAADAAMKWAAPRYGSIDAPIASQASQVWRAYDRPA